MRMRWYAGKSPCETRYASCRVQSPTASHCGSVRWSMPSTRPPCGSLKYTMPRRRDTVHPRGTATVNPVASWYHCQPAGTTKPGEAGTEEGEAEGDEERAEEEAADVGEPGWNTGRAGRGSIV